MRIIFIRNAFLDGHRYTAGECTDVSEALAAHLEELNIVHVERPAAVEEEPKAAPASPAQKKKTTARKKAVAK